MTDHVAALFEGKVCIGIAATTGTREMILFKMTREVLAANDDSNSTEEIATANSFDSGTLDCLALT